MRRHKITVALGNTVCPTCEIWASAALSLPAAFLHKSMGIKKCEPVPEFS